MRIRGALVDDFIQIKESRSRDAFLTEGLKTSAFLRIVGEEPCCTERDSAGRRGDFGGRVLFERGCQLGGCYEVGG